MYICIKIVKIVYGRIGFHNTFTTKFRGHCNEFENISANKLTPLGQFRLYQRFPLIVRFSHNMYIINDYHRFIGYQTMHVQLTSELYLHKCV
jgi:hypothetical protein